MNEILIKGETTCLKVYDVLVTARPFHGACVWSPAIAVLFLLIESL